MTTAGALAPSTRDYAEQGRIPEGRVWGFAATSFMLTLFALTYGLVGRLSGA